MEVVIPKLNPSVPDDKSPERGYLGTLGLELELLEEFLGSQCATSPKLDTDPSNGPMSLNIKFYNRYSRFRV